jgi:ribonuclease VapC
LIVDSSALIAILLGEPDAEVYADCIANAVGPRMAAPSWVEVSIVLEARGDHRSVEALTQLTRRGHLLVAPFDPEHAVAAASAWRRFGRGRHRAALNFGDCMSHGFATVEGEPLLFKGNDFSQTDIEPAIRA